MTTALAQENFTFQAIGTHWHITLDGASFRNDVKAAILDYVTDFDRRFSRFKLDSEANAFRTARPGTYEISGEFAVLLKESCRLSSLTNGVYDPAVGELLERAGYDPSYSMTPRSDIDAFELPCWKLEGTALTLDGPAVFDFGGNGKGYAIDKIADVLKEHGLPYFIVDGGGDIYATAKENGDAWRVAVEYPGRIGVAASVILLKERALAVSDSFRRAWKGWHHVVHPRRKRPIENIAGVAAIAPSAWYADSATSALYMAENGKYPHIAREYNAAYLVFYNDDTTRVSPNWPGELF